MSLVIVADDIGRTVDEWCFISIKIIKTPKINLIFCELCLNVLKFWIIMIFVYNIHHFTNSFFNQISSLDLPYNLSQTKRRIFSLFHYPKDFHSKKHPLMSQLFLDLLFLVLWAKYDQREIILCHKKYMLHLSKFTNIQVKTLQSRFISKKFSIFRT